MMSTLEPTVEDKVEILKIDVKKNLSDAKYLYMFMYVQGDRTSPQSRY